MTNDVMNPAVPPVADLISPRLRLAIYLVSAVVSAVWIVVEVNAELHWGWTAAWAGWCALINLLAASNTPLGQQAFRKRDGGFINDSVVWTLVGILIIVCLLIWLLGYR